MELSSRFTEALGYAAELHAHQRRKVSGEPYVAHLLAVTAVALQYGAGEDEAIAALLHDAIEDQGGAAIREEIRRRFGAEVVEIVDGCTDTDATPKPPWRRRKEAYLTRLRHASASVRLIKAADTLHNVRSVLAEYRLHGESLWRHFRGGREGSLWYYRAVTDTLMQVEATPAAEELDRTLRQLEDLVGQSQ